ncbi:amidohydrolase [Curtobacterium sp. MCBD17_034]|uniref:amidohydrolase n=1 Tax=unclassified Curtobacterium TaxID=257496 RepID=UPI000DA7E3FF|nr:MULTISPECIES: amidohydrolase [unclassified Curtobacterium]PZE73629.1 amidohydrolase [Curtobacterium sp. MCBD17_019]PZF56902.1 amidohydrolase [Curtobacterium sp. MCBD17_034]PZF60644.1 amidohydrolase [Curtobacterium sp. MCBD17_013]PZM33869.1 amidohydrolase [Curtobacterium sp. MCBD17_031]WIB64440.1 amidohydrolase [Curtobacterium sp. MCBD17_040]
MSKRSFVITGAHVVPVVGDEFDGGAVVVEDGRITAAGPDVAVPEGLPVVDAAGTWLVPGFVEAHGHVGIHEEANGVAGNDTNEMTGPNMAAVRAIDAIDIDDEGFRDALSGGVTAIVVKPGSGNPIGGQTVAIKSWGGRTIDEQLISDSVSVKSALGENPKRVYGAKDQTPSTRLGVAKVIREAFVAADHYRTARAAAAGKGEPFERDLTKETLARVLDGELAWDQHTHRHDDIATAIRLSEEFGYRLVVNHGTEGHKLAGLLAEKDIPVVYGPLFTSRSKVELRDRAITNLAEIAAAGVRVAITTDAPVVPINMLVLQATMAVKEGLPRQTALEALTTNPATFLGFGDRVGQITPGYDADLVLWSGDPLDATSRALRVFIDGAEVYTWDAEAHRGVTVPRF